MCGTHCILSDNNFFVLSDENCTRNQHCTKAKLNCWIQRCFLEFSDAIRQMLGRYPSFIVPTKLAIFKEPVSAACLAATGEVIVLVCLLVPLVPKQCMPGSSTHHTTPHHTTCRHIKGLKLDRPSLPRNRKIQNNTSQGSDKRNECA